MNAFFEDELRVSGIHLCILVKDGAGQHIHKNRPNHGLVLQLSGTKKYVFSGQPEMLVHAGELFYLPKFSSYEVVDLERGDCIAVNFDLTQVDRTYPAFCLSAVQSAKYVADFRDFLDVWQRMRTGYGNRCYYLLYKMLCGIQQDAAANNVQPRSRRLIEQAAEYIALHLEDVQLTVGGIAQELGVTPEYFRSLFSAVYGISPRKYIIQARVEKAKALLLSGEFTISHIAQMCGYESAAYFSREFKRITGLSPSAYAQQSPM